MNSFIFNSTADQLKASLYAHNTETVSALPLQADSQGALYVTSHAPLTICGSITISAPLTVGSLSVSGTITVANPITIANQCLTVSLAGRSSYLDHDSIYEYNSSETTFYFLESDISSFSTATLFLYNESNAVTVSVQLNPRNNVLYPYYDYLYIDDPNYTNIPIFPYENKILPLGIMARTMRLKCQIPLYSNIQMTAYLIKQV